MSLLLFPYAFLAHSSPGVVPAPTATNLDPILSLHFLTEIARFNDVTVPAVDLVLFRTIDLALDLAISAL
jgi:hypothetical protein